MASTGGQMAGLNGRNVHFSNCKITIQRDNGEPIVINPKGVRKGGLSAPTPTKASDIDIVGSPGWLEAWKDEQHLTAEALSSPQSFNANDEKEWCRVIDSLFFKENKSDLTFKVFVAQAPPLNFVPAGKTTYGKSTPAKQTPFRDCMLEILVENMPDPLISIKVGDLATVSPPETADHIDFSSIWTGLPTEWRTRDSTIYQIGGIVEDFPVYEEKCWRKALNILFFEGDYTFFRFQIYHNSFDYPINTDGPLKQKKVEDIGRPPRSFGECALKIQLPSGEVRVTLRMLTNLPNLDSPKKTEDLGFEQMEKHVPQTWISWDDCKVRPLTLNGKSFAANSIKDWKNAVEGLVVFRGHTEPVFELTLPEEDWDKIIATKGHLQVRLHLKGGEIRCPLGGLRVDGENHLDFDFFRERIQSGRPVKREMAVGCLYGWNAYNSPMIPDFSLDSNEEWSRAISSLLKGATDKENFLEFILLEKEESMFELGTKQTMELQGSDPIPQPIHSTYRIVIVREGLELPISLGELSNGGPNNPLDFSILRKRFHPGWPLNGSVKYIGAYSNPENVARFAADSDDSWKTVVRRLVDAGIRLLIFRLDNPNRKAESSTFALDEFGKTCDNFFWMSVIIIAYTDKGHDYYTLTRIGYLGNPESSDNINLGRLWQSSDRLSSIIQDKRRKDGKVFVNYSGPEPTNQTMVEIKKRRFDITSQDDVRDFVYGMIWNHFDYGLLTLEQEATAVRLSVGSKRPRQDQDLDQYNSTAKRLHTDNGDNFVSNQEYEEDEEDEEEEFDLTFQGLLESRDCEQYSSEMWRDCCIFFNISLETTSPRAPVHILGMKQPLYAFQAYAIFWMLNQQSGLCPGGFMADEQGLGKTAMFLGLLVVANNLRMAKREVYRDRHPLESSTSKSNTPRKRFHLDKSTPEDPQQGVRCPSSLKTGGRTFGMPCPCVENSITARLKLPTYAPALILCPKNLILNWEAEFHKWVNSDSGSDLRIAVLHGVKTGKEKTAIEKTIDTFVNEKREGQLIFVTTAASFKKHVEDKKYKIGFSHIIQDEFHLARNPKSDTMKLITRLALYKEKPRFLWAVSGTPFEVSTSDLEGHILILSDMSAGYEHWRSDERLEKALRIWVLERDYKHMVKIGMQWPQYKRREFLETLKKVLRALMIRRTSESTWHTQPIMPLERAVNKTILCNPNPEFDEFIEYLSSKADRDQEKIKTKTGLRWQSSAYKLRLAATVPVIAQYMKENPQWIWTEESLTKSYKQPNSIDDQYGKNIEAMVKSSDKIRQIEKLIMFHEMRTSRKDKKPEKFIIFSSFPAICWILYQYFSKTTSKDRKLEGFKAGMLRKCLLIRGGTTDKHTLVRAFQGDMNALSAEEKKNLSQKEKNAMDATILISTPRILGVGLTITRSRRVILVEPAYMNRDEDQAKARIRRHGQKETCYTYKFVNSDSRAERAIRLRQRRRRNINNATFKKPTDSDTIQQEAIEDEDLSSGEDDVLEPDERNDPFNITHMRFDDDKEKQKYEEEVQKALSFFDGNYALGDIEDVEFSEGTEKDMEEEKEDEEADENYDGPGRKTLDLLIKGLQSDFPSAGRQDVHTVLISNDYRVLEAARDLRSQRFPGVHSATRGSNRPPSIGFPRTLPSDDPPLQNHEAAATLCRLFGINASAANSALERYKGYFYEAYSKLCETQNDDYWKSNWHH